MSAMSGWSISALTGMSDPILGGMAIDTDRQRVWATEHGLGVLRIDCKTGDYVVFRSQLEQPESYGPITVRRDGSAFIAVNNSRRLLRFDAEVDPLTDLQFNPILGLSSHNDDVIIMSDQGNGMGVSCLTHSGVPRWTTLVTRGPVKNFFTGHTPIFCTDEGIIAIVAQQTIECLHMSYDGGVRTRTNMSIPGGSWNEELVASSAYDGVSPVGRRYLMDASYNARNHSVMLLYAPPSGNHGLVVIDWPLSGGMPSAYKIPVWTSRIICVANRLLCYGSEKFNGEKFIFTYTPSPANRIPASEVPVLSSAITPATTPLISQLFATRPA